MTDRTQLRPLVPRWLVIGPLITPLLRWAVLVHAAPAGEAWRTGCQNCGASFLPPRGFGALAPAGRCHECQHRIGAPPFLLELAAIGAAALIAVGAAGGWWSVWGVIGLAGWAAAAVALTFIDLAVHRLPDRFTLPALGWVLAWLGVAALVGGAGVAWVRAAIAGAVCGAGFALVTLIFGRRGFGLGDAKLALSVGVVLGWLGWTAVVAGLLLAFFASGLIAGVLLAIRRVGRRDSLPFGPFLAAGTLAALAWVGLSG